MTPFATALGLALVHFIWQGFVLGALIAGSLALLRDRPASVRYVVCCAGMGLLLATPVASTWILLRAPAGAWYPLPIPAARLAAPLVPVLPLLPIVWAGGVVLLQVRVIGAWIRAGSLRRVGTKAASPSWRREFEDLLGAIRVTRPVRLLESSRVLVPSVVGWLRPVVLVPASLATGLSPDQVRGLLAHELAHVRRHDYLVNLAQCVIESLLFFHPVTWWLSGRVRAEREFCCDDIAVAVGGGALAYARTLSSLEELRSRHALPVLSVKGGSLMTRITRLHDGARRGPGRAALVLAVVAVLGGVSLGALMAAGCFQGESATAAEGDALVGPGEVQAAADFTPDAADVSRILASLDAAVADGSLPAELVADVRAKIESGEARFVSATCGPDSTCDLPAGCEASSCTPEECAALTGGGEGEPVCVVVQCDESACPSADATGATALVQVVEPGS